MPKVVHRETKEILGTHEFVRVGSLIELNGKKYIVVDGTSGAPTKLFADEIFVTDASQDSAAPVFSHLEIAPPGMVPAKTKKNAECSID